MNKLLTSLLVMTALLVSPSYAQGLFPDIPKALGEPHPEGNEFWRINHPALLAHDRDLTVIEGIRDIDASLKSCVACHAVTGPASDPLPVTAESPEFSCRVCHEYVAVKISCFDCHASTPEEADFALVLPSYGGTPASLRAYLERISQ